METLIEGSEEWSDEDFKNCMRRITDTDAFYEFLNERRQRIVAEKQ